MWPPAGTLWHTAAKPVASFLGSFVTPRSCWTPTADLHAAVSADLVAWGDGDAAQLAAWGSLHWDGLNEWVQLIVAPCDFQKPSAKEQCLNANTLYLFRKDYAIK